MNKKKLKRSKKQAKQNKKFDSFSFITKNIIFLFFCIIFVSILYKSIGGYKWLWDSLVIGNFKTIKKYPDLTISQKYEIKCGFDYKYLDYIKKNTPEDAIILMPSREEIYPKGEKSDFNDKGAWGVKNKAWATYFLYPRKLVYEQEKDTNPFYEQINYVAIVNYRGYDKLNYKIYKKQKYQILHINIPLEK